MNDSNNYTLSELVDLPTVAIIIPEIVAIFCSLWGFTGNFLTVLTILLSPKLKRITNNWFVCNLSVVDSLFCAFALPIHAFIYHNREQPWGDQFCVWLAGLKYSLVGTSLLTLCTIALNRYIHVVHPQLQPRLFNKIVVITLILLCWIVPFSLSMVAVIGVWGDFGFQPRALTCAFDMKSDSDNTNSHRIVIYSLGVGVPIVFMGYCYTCIAVTVYHSQKKIQSWVSTRQSNLNEASDTRRHSTSLQLTKTMMIIGAVFIVCIAPYALVGSFDPDITCPECHLLTPMLSWIQISLNPVIYTITNSQFHQAYKRMCLILTCKTQTTTDIHIRASSRTTHNVQTQAEK